MIYANLENVSGSFELKIHYEHPIEIVNGSNLFLYDLNISPYLSASNPKSTAYFIVTFLDSTPNVHVFTTPSDGVLNPVDFNFRTQNQTLQVDFAITSEYSKPLLGDIIVSFNADPPAKPSNEIPVALHGGCNCLRRLRRPFLQNPSKKPFWLLVIKIFNRYMFSHSHPGVFNMEPCCDV